MYHVDRKMVKEILTKVTGSEIFTVEFIKKNGERRIMNCRKGVKKHLAGGTLKYNAIERNLLPVFDMQKEGYRMINIDTMTRLKTKGKEYLVTE